MLAHDPVVEAALQGYPVEKTLTIRTVQRHFLGATGLTQAAIHQIERAHRAAELLQRGVSILDTVHQAGYSDQPHLTKSLKRLLGRTPAQLAGIRNPQARTRGVDSGGAGTSYAGPRHVVFVQDVALPLTVKRT
jgi:methylphosphotriester-DNA--protein-cysteine methyltransferase